MTKPVDSRTLQTKQSLIADLRKLGVKQGMTLILHVSLSKLGWVCGGPDALLQALQEVLTQEGSLVMPAFTATNSEPKYWSNPPVKESWWPVIREQMPAFDPARTPSSWVGKVAEAFRNLPGVLRSNHPRCSFSAWGKHAERITTNHQLAFSMGDTSPLARIYEQDGHVLLLGVDFERNTSLHLAEHRAEWPGKQITKEGSSIYVNAQRQWVEFDDLECEEEDFMQVQEAFFEETKTLLQGNVGSAPSMLFSQREVVDFATAWFRDHRGK